MTVMTTYKLRLEYDPCQATLYIRGVEDNGCIAMYHGTELTTLLNQFAGLAVLHRLTREEAEATVRK